MRNKITIEEIEMLFEYAKQVHSNSITLTDAVNELSKEGINKRSAVAYLYNYSHMRKGELFTRTINAPAMRFYLDKILDENGVDSLNTALQSLSSHIEYYENAQRGNVVKNKNIFNEYKLKININTDDYFSEEFVEQDKFIEGSMKRISVNTYDRNSIARTNCIKHYGAICQVCEFDFGNIYGKLGDGFIHVHHIVDISTIKKEYNVDHVSDLVPVCPNCHAMLHKHKPAYSIDELKAIMTGKVPIK